MKCPRCGLEMDDGVCPGCGYTNKAKARVDGSSDAIGKIKNIITFLAVIFFLGYLLVNISMLIWSAETIIPETLTYEPVEGESQLNLIFIIIGFPVGIGYVTGQWFTLYYLFLLFSVLASLSYIFYLSGSDLVLYLKDVVKGKFDKLEKEGSNTSSAFLRLVTIFTALIFFSYVYILLIQILGPGIESPDVPQEVWKRVYSLLRASVWEEVTVRFAYIGVPMTIYGLVKGKKKATNYLLGGFGTNEKLAVYLVVLSSAIFALAHLPGWDIYKIPQTLIPGFAFGYLFIKDGLPSAILLHFFWNFMNVPDLMMDIPNFNYFFATLTFFWIVVGIYYTYSYLNKFTKWFKGESDEEEARETEELEEPFRGEKQTYTAGVTTGYICPNCRFNQARYTDEGKLKCKRCGAKTDPQSEYAQQRTGKVEMDREWPPS